MGSFFSPYVAIEKFIAEAGPDNALPSQICQKSKNMPV
jgi:hypothetical protein